MTYGKFARTYDQLMDKTLYDKWAQYVTERVAPKAKVLELACGTGDLAQRLHKTYDLVASDLSEDMLVLAQEKVPELSLMQLDMCDLPFQETFDAVLCFADSVCYLPNPESLMAHFQAVYQALKPSGVYLFDVHSLYQINQGFADYTFQYVDEETVFVWESEKGDDPDSVIHLLTCCSALESGLYERYDEVHYERTYPIETYKTYLEVAGFKQVDISADFGQSAPEKESTRWFFYCQK